MKNRFENATIIFKNGEKEFCNVITIVDEGVYTGFIESKIDINKHVIDHRFIPRDQIQKILFLDEGYHLREINFKNSYGGKKYEKKNNRNMCNDAVDGHSC